MPPESDPHGANLVGINWALMEIQRDIGKLLAMAEANAKHLALASEALNGNGHDGLIVKVDRLEQASKRQRTAIGVVFASLVGTIIEHFAK